MYCSVFQLVMVRVRRTLRGSGGNCADEVWMVHAGRVDENLAHGDFAPSYVQRCGEPRVVGGDCHRSTASPSWVSWGVSLLSPAGAMPARMRNDVSSPVSRSPTNCHARLIPTPRSPMMT
jgi:hypothetical protein